MVTLSAEVLMTDSVAKTAAAPQMLLPAPINMVVWLSNFKKYLPINSAIKNGKLA